MDTGIHADPEALFALADQVLGEPFEYMSRAQATVSTTCHLDWYAFGVAPAPLMIPTYNSGKDSFADTIGKAADTISAMANGFAGVAHTYGAAEDASDLSARSIGPLRPTGISTSGGAGTLIGEGSTIVVECGLLAIFAAVKGLTTACEVLAPAAIAAAAAWLLVEPIDTQINQAISGWQSAKNDVAAAKDALDDIVSHLDSAWASDDSARPTFDLWWSGFDGDLDRLKDAVGEMPDKLTDVIQELHTINTEAFVAAATALAALIVLTCWDWAAGAGEAGKAVAGLGLTLSTLATVASIGTVLVTFAGYLIDLSSKASGFNVSKPGDLTLPDFTQDSIDWSGLNP